MAVSAFTAGTGRISAVMAAAAAFSADVFSPAAVADSIPVRIAVQADVLSMVIADPVSVRVRIVTAASRVITDSIPIRVHKAASGSGARRPNGRRTDGQNYCSR